MADLEIHRGRKISISSKITSLLFLLTALMCTPTANGLAQDKSGGAPFPERPITIVVPFGAGGAFDVQARSIGQVMNALLEQPVIVDNLSGAGGVIGAGRVAKASPDGYSLLMGSLGPNAAAKALNRNLTYEPRTDFEPIVLVSRTPMVLVVRKDLPVKNLSELLEYAKSNTPSAGTAGVGSIADVALLLFSHITKMNVVRVPYRSLPASMNDLIAGRIDLMFDQIITAAPHLRAHNARALAVTSPQRSPTFPEIPTMAELGFPDVKVVAWGALFAPKNTPKPVIAILNKAANTALDDKRVASVFSNLGLEISPIEERTPEALGEFVGAEIEKWEPLLKSAEIKEK